MTIGSLLNNRYQIIEELGFGGFGTTYLAKDTQTEDSWCAIKQLNPQRADIETAKKLFKREADTLLRLQQVPQVPKFIEYFEDNSSYYIVEEYIEGISLEDLLTEPWNINNIIIFLWEILSILQLLHDKNIIHRDIKPSNLIQRQKDRKFTIIDFGAVKKIDPDGAEIGTRIYHQGYAPIEQMEGLPKLNSDIYALGMTAIQLLTKEPPREFIRDDRDRVIAPETRIAPVWLIDILNKMVKTDFQERYQSVEEVLKDLGQRNDREETEPLVPEIAASLSETKQMNNENTVAAPNLTPSSSRFNYKLLYLPLILFSLLLVGSELIQPWIRPWYLLRQANSLLDNNQPQNSLVKFQQATELKPNSAAAWKGKGDALFIMNRYLRALTAYEKAISLKPDYPKALNNKGKILYRLGELDQAIKAHQQSIVVDPNNADAWSSLGLVQMNLQEYQEALQSFDRAQTIAPDNPPIWLQKGIVLKALQMPDRAQMFYQEALAAYDEATSKEEGNPALWSDRGFVLLQLNQPQDAFVSYDRALAIDSNFYEALIGKANVYNLVRDRDRALALLNRASEIRPKDFQVWFNRGNLLLQAFNNPTEALSSFQQATKLNPNFYPAWLGKGFSHNALQQYEDAKLALNKAIELNAQDPYAWFSLGQALETLEEFPAAYNA